MPAEGEVAPQAFTLLGILGKAKNGMTLAELAKAAHGKLKTKQSVTAVWQHYQRDLREAGYITTVAVKEKKERPAKKAAAKKAKPKKDKAIALAAPVKEGGAA
jgi:hypothetical protein